MKPLSSLFRLGSKIKKTINILFLQLIEKCNLILFRTEGFPRISKYLIHGITRFFGDLAWLICDFPRMNAYQLYNEEWRIIFVGNLDCCHNIRNIFFKNENVDITLKERVFIGSLKSKSIQWLQDGNHLIILELSRLFPFQIRTSWHFITPASISQILRIPDNLNELLNGRHVRGQRTRINQAQNRGYSFRFTTECQDLDNFFWEMHIPFIKGRHGERAHIACYEDFCRLCSKEGGLIQILKFDKPVAGSLWDITGKTAHGLLEGVINNDPVLLHEGINSIIIWYTLIWSHQKGAHFFNFGRTDAWCENGIFEYKSRWNTSAVRHKRIFPNLHFISNNMPETLTNRLNEIRFLSEYQNKFFITQLLDSDDKICNLKSCLEYAQRNGLDGVIELNLDHRRTIHPRCEVSNN
jgi:hypothetical protein